MSDPPMTREPTWAVVEGDVRDRLCDLPAASVQCVVTSPPYWGLRDYGAEGQVGLEPTPEAYVQNMVEVFREVRRVLRDDGTVWLNLGDSYASSGQGYYDDGDFHEAAAHRSRPDTPPNLKPKDLVGIPWRVAFALQADGWYLRSDIIWAKPNPMPESVTDRPTKSHEYVFLLSKSARYYFDADAVRERWADERNGDPGHAVTSISDVLAAGSRRYDHATAPQAAGRNIRTVWNIATEPFPGAHFATFPKKLVEPCVKAGTSERGSCGECGEPFERVTERAVDFTSGSGRAGNPPRGKNGTDYVQATSGEYDVRMGPSVRTTTTGWATSCGHTGESVPCAVLDPFCGSGTTGVVALRLGRSFVGIELNPTYAEMARDRIRNDAPLFNVDTEAIR